MLVTEHVPQPILYIDADACPVKAEAFRVAERHGLQVVVVANAWLASVPRVAWIRQVTVGDALDAADDWIAELAGPGDLVITADIPLAARCVKAGATVLAPNGRGFTADSIGMDLALRNLMTDLRSADPLSQSTGGGPKPFSAKDRSAFLQALHEAVVKLSREG